jgi:hypothetical protein
MDTMHQKTTFQLILWAEKDNQIWTPTPDQEVVSWDQPVVTPSGDQLLFKWDKMVTTPQLTTFQSILWAEKDNLTWTPTLDQEVVLWDQPVVTLFGDQLSSKCNKMDTMLQLITFQLTLWAEKDNLTWTLTQDKEVVSWDQPAVIVSGDQLSFKSDKMVTTPQLITFQSILWAEKDKAIWTPTLDQEVVLWDQPAETLSGDQHEHSITNKIYTLPMIIKYDFGR